MNGRVFIYINNLINEIATKSGRQVEVSKVTKYVIDELLKSNKYSDEAILNGLADIEIKNILKNKFNIYETEVLTSKQESPVIAEEKKETKDNEGFANDFYDSIRITNSKGNTRIVNPNNPKESVETSDRYTETLQDDDTVEAVNLKNNSTVKNKTNKVVDERKKAKNKKEIFKRILSFVLAGSIAVNIAFYLKKQLEKKEFIDTFDERISAEINKNDPNDIQNIFYTKEDNPNIITKNSKPVYGDNKIYTDYVEEEIAADIKSIIKNDPQALNTMLLYTFSHMRVDLASAIKSMNEILRELGIQKDFPTYIKDNLENLTEDMQKAVESYSIHGLTEENKNGIQKLVDAYLKTRYNEYQKTYIEGQEWSENLNGPSKH